MRPYLTSKCMTASQEARIKARNIPAGYTVYKQDENAVCYISECGLIAKMFKGTAQKPVFWVRFKTKEALEAYASEYFRRFEGWAKRKSERKSEPTESQIVKKALQGAFPYKMSITKGSGTASAWIHVNVYGVEADAKKRMQLHDDIYKAIKLALAQASEAAGKKYSLSTYCSDDGYNSERECLLIQFHQ